MTVEPAAAGAVRPCPQCGGRSVSLIHKGRFVLPEVHPLEPVVQVVACTECGQCFNDTANTRADYDRYYREVSKYADPRLSSGAGAAAEDRQRLDELAGSIADYAGRLDGSVLDVGCGAGGLLDSLRTVGFTSLAGMDPSPACATEVSRRGHRGLVGTLDDHALDPGETFSGVVLSHVMEHVCDVPAALAAVSKLVAPDGWLYVEVPDATRYAECLIAPFQDFNLEHINHFSSESLGNVLRAHGWRIDRAGGKTLALPQGRGYPAIYAFARWADSLTPSRDDVVRESLADYVAQSSRMMGAIDRRLQKYAIGRPIAVWGVGQLTMRLLGETSLGRAEIAVFVDSNPIHQGRTLAGRKVVAPQQVSRHVGPAVPILIGSLVNLESIERSIRHAGIHNPILRLDVEGGA